MTNTAPVQLITFFAASWDGDENALPLAEGVNFQFLAPDHLDILTIPPFIRDGINRYLATRPACRLPPAARRKEARQETGAGLLPRKEPLVQ
ncbi:hypothetical protein ABT404_08100 [Streptomyces hyaluromycini]|uniref:Uncharacterized protein n=1 Tax=Streptomyces hyaluromycini TaxID=1377993 RepID=A0ABV1WRF3_9ACTN